MVATKLNHSFFPHFSLWEAHFLVHWCPCVLSQVSRKLTLYRKDNKGNPKQKYTSCNQKSLPFFSHFTYTKHNSQFAIHEYYQLAKMNITPKLNSRKRDGKGNFLKQNANRYHSKAKISCRCMLTRYILFISPSKYTTTRWQQKTPPWIEMNRTQLSIHFRFMSLLQTTSPRVDNKPPHPQEKDGNCHAPPSSNILFRK